jgi:magnesium-transporting ATPase (P-type)
MTTPATTTGLTTAEVAERIARGEVNRVRRSDLGEYLDILRRNTLTLFNALVVPAAVILFALGEWQDGCAVSGMALTNTVLGLVQEIRAKRHLDKLTLLAETRVRVVRDGKACEVASGDVVRGDLVLLAAGDPVVADGTLREAQFLEVDEALLTGESDPVPRRAGDRVLSGSFCVAGQGGYVAEQVGAASFAQRTAGEARAYRYTASPMQETIDRLIRILTTTAVVLCAGYVVLYSAWDLPQRDLVRMVAATITSMVPQGLVLMATFAFVLGAVRLAGRGAVVRRLSAVESMAAVNTLCMDKTGTLTTNRLHLERLEVIAAAGPPEEVRHLLRLFASASGDDDSKAVAALRAALGVAAVERVDFLPFKAQNRYSAVRVRCGGSERALVLGACEALQPQVAGGGEAWEGVWQDLLSAGLRVLMFAEGAGGRPKFDGLLEGLALRPLALIGLGDELRPQAAIFLQELTGQGIGLKIVSGDNQRTVCASIATLAGGSPALKSLLEAPAVTGAELEAAGDRAALICERAVFGRVSPWQKVEIVTTLKAHGRHVAMLGDGVNDVLPIKQANLGVAMGAGSRASKAVAGLVLQTNDFGLLPQTLREGRTIVRNVRRAAKLFLTKNVYMLVLVIGFGLAFPRLPFPFLPRQVTLLNFLTIGIPALLVMLGREASPAAPQPGFLREVGSFVLRSGLVMGAGGLWLLWDSAGDKVLQRTLLLSLLVWLGLVTLVRSLRDGEQGRPAGDARLYFMVPVAWVVYLVVMYWPPAASFFELRPLPAEEWGRVILLAVPLWGLLVLGDLYANGLRWFRATSAATRPGG